MNTLQEETLNQTFRLAYFLHRNRPLARQIAAAALESLETTTLRQDKRFYYAGQRTKISFTELHLLQRLVYEKSDPFERARESDPARPLRAERLLIHFIKHLVWITARRNSFYVTLGLSRLLHRYTTAEMLELYNLVLQDPGRVPGEDYCRNRKKKLMEELLSRFGDLLKTTQETRGALRFVTHDEPARFAATVKDCLAAFTPWQTGCHVPEKFSPLETTLPAFTVERLNPDPDATHTVEIKRYHALLHPECLTRLLRALGYAPAAERLDIPRFYSAVPTDTDDDDPAESVSLTASERAELLDYLHDREQRRKHTKATQLRFVAHGHELARLDLEQTAPVRFVLKEYAEFLEIRTATDDLLLATHQLRYDDEDRLLPQDAVIVLPNGHRLAFTASPTHNTITVADAVPAAQPGWRQWFDLSAWFQTPRWQPAFGLALLALLAAGLLYLFLNRPATPPREIVYTASPTPTPQPSPTAAITPTPQPKSSATPFFSEDVIATNLRTRADDETASLTRGERADAVTLLAARKIYLELGADAFTQSLRTQLVERLNTFTLTDNRDEADIALKVNAASVAPNRLALIARIVNAHGKIIWPLTPRVSGRKYEGPTDKVIEIFGHDLARDLRQLKQK